MKKLIFSFLAMILPLLSVSAQGIYDFSMNDIDGKQVSLSEYKGKVVMVVNVASKCGLTNQYEGLEALYKKYKDKGLVILGFPCNQFMGQEPGTEAEIYEFCTLNYGVTFPMFAKIEVNGDGAHPLYSYLRKLLPGTGKKSDIEWNFAKFLIGRDGKPVERFHPKVKPEEMVEAIEKLL